MRQSSHFSAYLVKMILILTSPFILSGCQSVNKKQASDLPPPNILWISCEDISPALGCYGDPYARTPTLDRLAEEGVLYTRAYAQAPICSPARSTLITGVYATTLGTQHLRSDIPMPKGFRILPSTSVKPGTSVPIMTRQIITSIRMAGGMTRVKQPTGETERRVSLFLVYLIMALPMRGSQQVE